MNKTRSLAIATAVLAASIVVAALKLLQPASLSINIFSGNGTKTVTSVPGLYTIDDMLTVSGAMLIAGLSSSFLLFYQGGEAQDSLGSVVLDERKARWQELSKTLKDDEVKVYQVVLDGGGLMSQGELVTKSGLSKATVSRTLDLLESKGLVEKRRRGMGNVVFLK